MDTKQLVYDKSVAGRRGYSLPVTEKTAEMIVGVIPKELRRNRDANLPEITEPEVMRHFVALSVKNHHIEKGFYPLGSCTMKYNPKRNDAAAGLVGFRDKHPLSPVEYSQGILELMYRLKMDLSEVSGFPQISLQPVAGAHGEFAGLLIMQAYFRHRGEERDTIIIPDSAHGTNPASVTSVGYKTRQIKSNDQGVIDPRAVAEAMDESVAGLMLTNPNTLGIFETHIKEIADIVHAKGGLMYMDGANLNANMGIFRPGDVGFDMMHFNLHKTMSTPHGGGGPGAGAIGVVAKLAEFLPFPVVERNAEGAFYLDHDRPNSIGRLHSFYGNVANIIRAYAYVRTLGGKGLKKASENAVLNANYLKESLKDAFDLPHETHCMHEFVLSGSRQKKLGVKTSDMAKRMLDFGFHPPTVYFPLIVPEAMMIEPTETESKETLDHFIECMKQIAHEAAVSPELVTSAPHTTPVRRLDEVGAVRNLDICLKG